LAIKLKGVRKDMTKMRAGLFSFNLQNTSLGDKRGIRISVPAHSDIEKKIGASVKRSFNTPHSSKPLKIEQPKNIRHFNLDDGVLEEQISMNPSNFSYIMTLAENTLSSADNFGILEALSFYKHKIYFRGKRFLTINEELKNAWLSVAEMKSEDEILNLIEEIEGVNINADDFEIYDF
jgi:hypothetical protein